MDLLRPCPFCGGDATTMFEARDDEDSTVGVVYVQCRWCKAKSDEEWTEPCITGEYLFSDILSVSAKAAKKWNRRVDDGGEADSIQHRDGEGDPGGQEDADAAVGEEYTAV